MPAWAAARWSFICRNRTRNYHLGVWTAPWQWKYTRLWMHWRLLVAVEVLVLCRGNLIRHDSLSMNKTFEPFILPHVVWSLEGPCSALLTYWPFYSQIKSPWTLMCCWKESILETILLFLATHANLRVEGNFLPKFKKFSQRYYLQIFMYIFVGAGL